MRRACLSTLLTLLLATPGCSRVAHDRHESIADDAPAVTVLEEDGRPAPAGIRSRAEALVVEASQEDPERLEDETPVAVEVHADVAEGDPDATQSLVKALQSQLVALGFAPGYPDGALGERTRIALADFQRDRRLPATGYADAATLTALFGEEPDAPDGEIVRTRGVDAAPKASSLRPRLTRTRTFGFGAGIGFLVAAALAAVALVSRRRK